MNARSVNELVQPSLPHATLGREVALRDRGPEPLSSAGAQKGFFLEGRIR